MQEEFTQTDLIRFIYRETNAAETITIWEALEANADLYAEYQSLLIAYQETPKVTFSPSDAAIDNILDYSKQTTLV